MKDELADKLALLDLKKGLDTIRRAQDVFRPAAGIINSVAWGGVAALSAVGTMHNLAGHAEFAARYLGAGQAVAGYAVAATAASAIGYAALKLAETFQKGRLKDKQAEINIKEKLQPVKKQEPQREKQAEQVIVKERPKEQYRKFSNVLKPKRVMQHANGDEHVRA